MQWNPNILNKFIAPGITEFTEADIPDLSNDYPQAPYWLVNHFLNNALGSCSFKNRWRQVVLAYLRRAHNAFHAYHEARASTFGYLENNNPLHPQISKYFKALSCWENFSLQMSMAMDLFKMLNEDVGAFKKNDGSKEQRLYGIANMIKHTASAVKSGQCKESDTVPLWLSNHGLHSFDSVISYVEVSEVLGDASKLAEDYQDPYSLREKWTNNA